MEEAISSRRREVKRHHGDGLVLGRRRTFGLLVDSGLALLVKPTLDAAFVRSPVACRLESQFWKEELYQITYHTADRLANRECMGRPCWSSGRLSAFRVGGMFLDFGLIALASFAIVF